MTSALGSPVADLMGDVGFPELWASMIERYGRCPRLINVEPAAGQPRVVLR
jgi:hypothetical protein